MRRIINDFKMREHGRHVGFGARVMIIILEICICCIWCLALESDGTMLIDENETSCY